MRLAQERVLPKGHTLPGQDKVCQICWANRGPGSAGNSPALWLAQSVLIAAAGPPLPKPPTSPGPFTRTPQSPGQASREGGAHLCSRSPHLCLPGWWTPSFCHTWHSGSRTCARTVGEERRGASQTPGTGQPGSGTNQAPVPTRLPALLLILRGWQDL